MSQHLSITQTSVIALITQIVAFVAGFGVLNSTTEGIVISAATAVVAAAFVVGNAIHHLAESKSS